MAKVWTKDEKLDKIGEEFVGNGGNSRLDIMLNKDTGEVFSNEFYDHEQNSWTKYENQNIVLVGRAKNYSIEGADADGVAWDVEIFVESDGIEDRESLSGDEWNDGIDADGILEVIAELYGLEA